MHKNRKRFASLTSSHQAKNTTQANGARFKPISVISPRGRCDEPHVRLFDDFMVINSAFGRKLDDMRVSAFAIFADDEAEELALKVFINGEEKALKNVDCDFDIIVLRPNGINKNAGRRINIRRAMQARSWLAKQMLVSSEEEARRLPEYDAAENLFVLRATAAS